MTIVGLDDTDSRTGGMCTTYLTTRLAERLGQAGASVERQLLIRLNPAVKHKTRGNAALAIHTDLDAEATFELATTELLTWSIDDDPRTSPGIVVADVPVSKAGTVAMDGNGIPADVATFAEHALRHRHRLEDALDLIEAHEFLHAGFAAEGCSLEGRGRIGALAAVGAFAAFDEWTYEHICYREFERCGTQRLVDGESVFKAAESGYPTVWDTVDRGEGDAVCVPNAPGPILYGIRGDDPDACRAVADGIDGEPVDRATTFITNQGTDAHLEPGTIGSLRDGAGYRIECVVCEEPETRRGGHVFIELGAPQVAVNAKNTDSKPADGEGPGPEPKPVDKTEPDRRIDTRHRLTGIAFEPTKRFRDRVRALRPGDRLTVCGEVERDAADPDDRNAIKLEKLAVRELVTTELVNPTCPECDRSMASAGRGQGYRCRDCSTTEPTKTRRSIDRELARGWYEVPPCARRHVAKPLVRGGFDAPVHPER